MRKSIIDILNKSNLNLVEEYHKLYEMFCYDEMCYHGNHHYSLSKIFEVFIKEWKYRGTRLCIEDVFEDLNLGDETTKTNPLEDILNLIDLIFNIYSFTKYLSSSGYEIYFDRDSFLLENSSYILNKLGYSIVEKEGYDVVLLKKHADATSTALMLDEKENDISELILNYNDFRIEKNIDEKRKILIDLGNYLEPERKKLKSVNPGLEDAIFLV